MGTGHTSSITDRGSLSKRPICLNIRSRMHAERPFILDSSNERVGKWVPCPRCVYPFFLRALCVGVTSKADVDRYFRLEDPARAERGKRSRVFVPLSGPGLTRNRKWITLLEEIFLRVETGMGGGGRVGAPLWYLSNSFTTGTQWMGTEKFLPI